MRKTEIEFVSNGAVIERPDGTKKIFTDKLTFLRELEQAWVAGTTMLKVGEAMRDMANRLNEEIHDREFECQKERSLNRQSGAQ
jgi:hypothetical protein